MHLTSDAVVRKQLDVSIKRIEDILDATALTFIGEIRFGSDDSIRNIVRSAKNKRENLVVVLETPGGYAEVVKRISDVFRKHFKCVDFIIPNYAMSAGTILVMSGDKIYMDDYSILGPTDPQIENFNGQMVPALGYLRRYEALLDQARNGSISEAEIQLLIDGFDQAELYKYEQAEKLSHTLLIDWLVKYKFKDWKQTETRKIKVTDKMKKDRAEEIAKKLSDSDRWHSHGRGISLNDLRSDINLFINDFSEDKNLEEAIQSYYNLLKNYMQRIGATTAIHMRKTFVKGADR